MGINDEYSHDAYYEQTWDSDDTDEPETDLHPEDWQDFYSDELLDGWTYLMEYVNSRYLTFKNRCNFPKFVELVMHPERFVPRNVISHHAEDAWTCVRRVTIIRSRVYPENFATWFDIYVG